MKSITINGIEYTYSVIEFGNPQGLNPAPSDNVWTINISNIQPPLINGDVFHIQHQSDDALIDDSYKIAKLDAEYTYDTLSVDVAFILGDCE